MNFTYYSGCSLHATGVEYDLSSRAVLKKLGVQLKTIADWNCCGATSAHATNNFLAVALPLRNLVLAEQLQQDIIVPCAGCYNALRTADYHVRENTEEGEWANREINEIMGKKYSGSIMIKHILDVLTGSAFLDMIQQNVVKPLRGLKVVPYYGCMILRPPHIVAFENPEQPKSLDTILGCLGVEVKQWSYKTDCCGGSYSVSRTDIAKNLTLRLVEEAKQVGAQAIVTACPLCFTNLDTRQVDVGKDSLSSMNNVPIFYITELLGLAFGLTKSKSWFRKHLIDPMPLLNSLNLL